MGSSYDLEDKRSDEQNSFQTSQVHGGKKGSFPVCCEYLEMELT